MIVTKIGQIDTNFPPERVRKQFTKMLQESTSYSDNIRVEGNPNSTPQKNPLHIKCFDQSPFNFLIPQAVDHWVYHGSKNPIQH